MKKNNFKKIPLIVAPVILSITPLIALSIKKNDLPNVENNELKINNQINQIVNDKLSLKNKINQLKEKLKSLQTNIIDVIQTLKQKIADLEYLNIAEKYTNDLNLETTLSDKLPEQFNNYKNKIISINNLNLKKIPSYKDITFEYKLISINNIEGNIVVEIKLKYKNYSSSITKIITNFKKFDLEPNNSFKNIEWYLNQLVISQKQNDIISHKFSRKDKVKDFINKLQEKINQLVKNNKNILITSENAEKYLKDLLKNDEITINLKIKDLKNNYESVFKDIKFKLKNAFSSTIFINEYGKEQTTTDRDLSNLKTTEIIQIGFYEESSGVIRAPQMPKTIKKVPSELPKEITNLNSLFSECTDFNQDLSSWDVSNVTSMYSMFENASAFNGNISSWDVSNVNNMSRMFRDAFEFNSDISKWKLIKVINMGWMFYNAKKFNSNISSWNVSNVVYMHNMFENALKFNQDLSSWNVIKVKTFLSFAHNSGFSYLKHKWPPKFRI